jgi:guanylate kinase
LNLPPVLSKDDRAAAALKAVLARKERAEIKNRLASGEISLFDLFGDPRDSITRMKLSDALKAVPGIGSKRAELIFAKTGISKSRRIAGVGRKQIELLRQELILMKTLPQSGKLIVVSGPSGVGKSTITNQLKNNPKFWVSISATTRQRRNNEVENKDYKFVSDSQFDQMVANNEFLEWAEFTGAKYGTPAEPVKEALSNGFNVILEIELNGARQVRKNAPDAILVFIEPPSWQELESRLLNRGTESSESVDRRLARAKEELIAASEFDFVLVNTQVDQVVAELVSLALGNSR